MVVDAPVVHDGKAKLGIDHRLVAPAREVDDGQAPVPESHASGRPHPGSIGAAGSHDVGHAGDGTHVGQTPVHPDLTGNPAHLDPPLGTRRLRAPPLKTQRVATQPRTRLAHDVPDLISFSRDERLTP